MQAGRPSGTVFNLLKTLLRQGTVRDGSAPQQVGYGAYQGTGKTLLGQGTIIDGALSQQAGYGA